MATLWFSFREHSEGVNSERIQDTEESGFQTTWNGLIFGVDKKKRAENNNFGAFLKIPQNKKTSELFGGRPSNFGGNAAFDIHFVQNPACAAEFFRDE